MRRGAGLSATMALVATLVGCGSGTTTTVVTNKAVTESKAEANGKNSTYLPSPAFAQKYVEPSEYSFMADGSLVGKHLNWVGWGTSIATARATIEERDFSGGFNDRPTYPGAVVASGLEECRGRSYYTEVVAQVPADAVYVPEKASQLITPCRSFEEIQEEEVSTSTGKEAGDSQGAESRSRFFQTPSHNIGCGLSPEGVRCDIRDKSWTPPSKPSSCPNEYGNGFTLPSEGPALVECAGDTILGIGPVLPYGHSVRIGNFRCSSAETGVTCLHLGTPHGFELSFQNARWF